VSAFPWAQQDFALGSACIGGARESIFNSKTCKQLSRLNKRDLRKSWAVLVGTQQGAERMNCAPVTLQECRAAESHIQGRFMARENA
jgi:hypothetical protein